MRKRILIVDDDISGLYMLSFLLRSHNYEIFEATNGREGLNKARELKPDVILLDIQMPEMNGFEVCQQLKQEEEMKEIPIILFTSYGMAGHKKKAIESGADGYIEKPVNPDVFISQVESIIKSFKAGFRF
jgi:CheY-like chemotaxis protein